MTTQESQKLIGSVVLLTDVHRDIRYPVKIMDVKTTFGKIRVLAAPVGGEGQRWINFDNSDDLKITI